MIYLVARLVCWLSGGHRLVDSEQSWHDPAGEMAEEWSIVCLNCGWKKRTAYWER